MEGIRERCERALRQRADGSEESCRDGDGYNDRKFNNNGKINIVVRREEEGQKEEER